MAPGGIKLSPREIELIELQIRTNAYLRGWNAGAQAMIDEIRQLLARRHINLDEIFDENGSDDIGF